MLTGKPKPIKPTAMGKTSISTTRALVVMLLLALLFIERLEYFSCSTTTTTTTTTKDSNNNNVSYCIESERLALIKLRENLTDYANRLSSWVGNDCCTWTGVGCNRKENGGHVVKLDLRNPIHFDDNNLENFYNNSLTGRISPSLLDLKHLHYLDLSMNDFSFIQIPDFFGSLKSLRYLDLSHSHFNGTIPHHLGNLSRLQYLNLSFDYHFYGPIPDTLGRLSSLTVLDLSASALFLKMSLPHFLCNLSNLVYMDLSDNYLQGSLPCCLGQLSSLSILKISQNWHLKGPIPSEMGNMTQLTELDLSHNDFEGEIPNSIRNLCSLLRLDLSSNKFSGKLSTSLGNPFGCIYNSLKLLNLEWNEFSGSLPNHLGDFKNLEYLYISYNEFSGSLPSSLGRLSFLRELVAINNQLNGSIPTSLGQLSKLEILDLSNNSFVGMVSELHFAKLKSLKQLSLSLNSLVLNVSSQWVPSFQLQIIGLASCKVGPQFPPWLQTQRHVEMLDMSNASISDTIPGWFEKIYSHIHYLNLFNNQIKGKLPKFRESKYCDLSCSWDRELILSSNKFEGPITPVPSDVKILDLSNNLLSYVEVLDLSNNLLSDVLVLDLSNNLLSEGGILVSLCKANNILVIDFSNNHLSGKIPQCLGNLTWLLVLDLTNNNLYGHVPNSLGSLRRLKSLHLRNNRFHGKLPWSFQNLTSLVTLDLGENEFIDIIPPWIGSNLSSLTFLNLQSNNFYGDIPPQLCLLSDLQVLNLAQNKIVGKIPPCFSKFTGMISLDWSKYSSWAFFVGQLHYEDKILQSMKGRELEFSKKTLKFLTSIDLSSNNIAGEIPEELMDLVGLENLNLSGNHLKGRIPEKIGNLKQLESLDLSRNKLFGSIPSSLSALSYLSHLNLSFNNLSGPIPKGNQLQVLENQCSIYMGNDGLSGAPLLESCTGDKSWPPHGDKNEDVVQNEGGDQTEFVWFYAGIGPGFSVGFLGFCGILYFKKSWRYAYFKFIEESYNRIFVAIAVKAAWLRRKFNRGKE